MKNKSPRLMIAGWLLVAAFVMQSWSLYLRWSFAFEVDAFARLVSVTNSVWFADLLYFPSALFLPFSALIGGVLGLSLRKKWAIVVGASGFLGQFPLGFLADFAYASQDFWTENPLVDALERLIPRDWLGYLYYSGFLLAGIALTLATIFKSDSSHLNRIQLTSNPENLSAENQPIKLTGTIEPGNPVAYDTQTGRPISGYDTQTGEPIYVDGPIDKKTD